MFQRRTGEICLLSSICLASTAFGQVKAFPQAEGFGAVSVGGRGGDVYHVTNLTDSGVGSLRYGIENAPSTGRTIVFDVGGWINLTSKLGVTKNKITIAGQTAPGGIGLRGNQFSVGSSDLVVRHMRFRPGKGAGRVDAAGANINAKRIIYDHVSVGFSYDESFSTQADNLTLQYSSVSFGMEDHSAGSLIEDGAGNLSFHHNVYAHNDTRNPKARAKTMDWRDNVVYNYNNGFIAGDSTGTNDPGRWRANFDGNTYITRSTTNRPMITGGRDYNYDLWYGSNAIDMDGNTTANPVTMTYAQARSAGAVVSSYNVLASPIAAPVVWQAGSPAAAYEWTLNNFGATPWARDAVDAKTASDIRNRTGSRVSNENQLGIANAGYPTLGGVAKPTDTDNDGIPDAWEIKHGTNPAVANHNADFDSDGYTDIEEYLNDLAAMKAIGDINFTATSGRYALPANWINQWEPSRMDTVTVNGTAVVDAVGQKAGKLLLGTAAGRTGTLNVTGGWIETTDDLQLGPVGTGNVNQTGGTVFANGGVLINSGTYTLSGGTLSTPILAKNAGGAFVFTGGTLDADRVTFDLTNNGGTISPGNSPGTMTVQGNFAQTSGTLLIELGAVAYDVMQVSGTATLGGTLDVTAFDGFVAADGQAFTIIDANAITGTFANVIWPDNRAWGVVYDQASGDVRVGVNIPEPASVGVLVGAAAMLLRRRK